MPRDRIGTLTRRLSMSFTLVNDEEVLHRLAGQFDQLRRQKGLMDSEIAARGGTTVVTISNFRSGANINLTTLIRLLRGLGELDRLESLFQGSGHWHPDPKARPAPKKRVRRSQVRPDGFKWGDES